MKNNQKILVAFASFLFFAALYFFISSQKIETPKQEVGLVKESVLEKVDLVELEINYKNNVKEIYSEIKEEVEEPESLEPNIDQELQSLKNRLIALVVPEEYRAFHLSLVMLIDEIVSNNYQINSELREAVINIGKENNWLN